MKIILQIDQGLYLESCFYVLHSNESQFNLHPGYPRSIKL